jgi:hypothetical protein
LAGFDDDDFEDLENCSLKWLHVLLNRLLKHDITPKRNSDPETIESLQMLKPLMIQELLEEIKRRENHGQQTV